MDAFDWEERDEDTPFYIHMIAGSLSGISEHLSMIPVDNVKTHCQAGRNMPVVQIVRKIYRAGGLSNFYAGSSVVAAGCAPAHAIYFSIYEKAMKVLNCNPQKDTVKFAFVGALSAMFHDLMMTPTETLKQRTQLLRSENSKISIVEVAKTVYKREGMVAFYRSFPVNYAMNIPFGSLIVVFNEKLKHFFGVKEGDHSLNYYLCGAAAGALSSIPTTPLDVIKTKLNTQYCQTNQCQKVQLCNVLKGKIQRLHTTESDSDHRVRRPTIWLQTQERMSTAREGAVKYKNVWDTASIIYKQEGLSGFFKGMKMRMAIQSASSGVAWGTYQIIKNYMAHPTH